MLCFLFPYVQFSQFSIHFYGVGKVLYEFFFHTEMMSAKQNSHNMEFRTLAKTSSVCLNSATLANFQENFFFQRIKYHNEHPKIQRQK